jgi:phosphatidylethanolamine-binding protein (PEBP) family uncharacterized protein
MAQGTIDKRFLTKSPKTASARILLALAVSALLLAGCGGGSSDSSGSSTSGSTAATNSAASEADAGPGSGADAGADVPSASDVTGAGSAGAPGEQPAPGGKHGSSVPLPTGAPAPTISPEQRKEATVADINLESPSSLSSAAGPPALPAQYTCDGKSTSPALRWQGVPEGTTELALFAMNIRPVEGKLFFDWAVAGLSPELEEIKAGELPKGAVVGRNSFGKTGYEICPEGGGETYMFTLFALPKSLSPAEGFDPLALRKTVLDSSGNVGLLALSYARG